VDIQFHREASKNAKVHKVCSGAARANRREMNQALRAKNAFVNLRVL